jgi:hypothetical protein
MAADHMTLSSQETDLLPVQGSLFVNLAGGDKKCPRHPYFSSRSMTFLTALSPTSSKVRRKGIVSSLAFAESRLLALANLRHMGTTLVNLIAVPLTAGAGAYSGPFSITAAWTKWYPYSIYTPGSSLTNMSLVRRVYGR